MITSVYNFDQTKLYKFRELTYRDYFDLYKASNLDLYDFFLNAVELLERVSEQAIDAKQLNIIDFFIFWIHINSVSYKSELTLRINDPSSDGGTQEQELNILEVIQNCYQYSEELHQILTKPSIIKSTKNESIYVEFQLPTVECLLHHIIQCSVFYNEMQNLAQDNLVIDKNTHEVTLNKNNTELPKQISSLLDSAWVLLPAYYLKSLSSNFFNIETQTETMTLEEKLALIQGLPTNINVLIQKKIDKIIQLLQFTLINLPGLRVPFSIEFNTYIDNFKLFLLHSSLEHLYREAYWGSQLGISYETMLKLTPREADYFSGIVGKLEKESEIRREGLEDLFDSP